MTFDSPGGSRLRARFNEAAELYDRARPGYPDALFDDLVALAGLRPGARILEIGCGTGQATLPLAERGYTIDAVELGAGLASVARRKLARFPNVTVHVATFEEWALPVQPYDVVLAATSWHWVDPAVRFVKAAEALRPGGALVVVDTLHIAGGTSVLFAAVQAACYAVFMGDDPMLRLQDSASLPVALAPSAGTERFDTPVTRSYERDIAYSTAEYIDVLSTYSGHRDLPPEEHDGLLGCIARVIDERFGGRIAKRYRNDLVVARRREIAGGETSA